MASVLKCEYAEEWDRSIKEGSTSNEYTVILDVQVDTRDMVGGSVLSLARAFEDGDPIPYVGQFYNVLGHVDLDSRCSSVTCNIKDDDDLYWRVTVEYKEEKTKEDKGGPKPPSHPLLWPITPWLEIQEDNQVVERAVSFSKLSTIKRGLTETKEPGPIGNAAGQQTVDPLLDPKQRYILNVLIYYPNELYAVALNNQFGDTVHCHKDFKTDPMAQLHPPGYNADYPPLILGCPYYTWRFMGAVPDKPAWRQVVPLPDEPDVEGDDIETHEGAIKYTPTLLKFEFKKGYELTNKDLGIDETTTPKFWSGWIHKVLNNGQVCFKKWISKVSATETVEFIKDPRFGDDRPMQFPTTAMVIKDDFNIQYKDPRPPSGVPRPHPTMADMVEQTTSEPVNLNLDGTQITDPEAPPTYIYSLELTPANYFKITDYFGNSLFSETVELPVFPLGD